MTNNGKYYKQKGSGVINESVYSNNNNTFTYKNKYTKIICYVYFNENECLIKYIHYYVCTVPSANIKEILYFK